MALSNFISKLNWRLVVIHFVALWFFIFAFKEFSFLHDFNYLFSITHRGGHNKPDIQRVAIDAAWEAVSCFVGLLTGFLISLAISIKKKWYWVNSLIAFLTVYLLWRFGIMTQPYLRYLFAVPGLYFKDNTIWYFLINGLIMLAIGLMLFFLKRVTEFIKPKVVGEKQEDVIV